MNHRTRNLLLVILALSVLLRVVVAFVFGNQVVDLPGTADQVSYHTLALRVLGGHGFTFGETWWPATRAGEPTAHWSYLYTGYLVLVYALFGPNPLAARLIQAVLAGLAMPYLAFLLGKRVLGELVGLFAAALTAVYAYFVYYTATLMTEPFYIIAILSSFYLAFELVEEREVFVGLEDGTWRRRLGIGAGLGFSLLAAILLRQLFLLFVPFLFLWVVLRGRKYIPALSVSAIVIVLGILPFTAFNYARFNRFVLLNTNAGFAFFWGNNPVYGTHFVPILPSGEYYQLIPENLRSLNEAALDQALLSRGIGFVMADPGRYLLLSLSRIPPYFMFWPSPDSEAVSNIARVASFGILWPFMLFGLVYSMLQKPSPWRLRPISPLLLLYVFILVYAGIHILTWTLIRYRLPIDAVLLLFAGLALQFMAERVPFLQRLVNSFA